MTVSAAISIGTPNTPAGFYIFAGFPLAAVPDAFVVGTGAEINQLVITDTQVEMNLTSATSQEFTQAWEQSPEAITFVRSDSATFRLAGPDHRSVLTRDSTHPYRWVPKDLTDLRAFFAADASGSYSIILSDEDNDLVADEADGLTLSVGLSNVTGKIVVPALNGEVRGWTISVAGMDAIGDLEPPSLNADEADDFGLSVSLGDVTGDLGPATLRGRADGFSLRLSLGDISEEDVIRRTEDAAVAAGQNLEVGWLLQVQSNSGTTYRFCSGINEITVLGQTWQPTGEIVSISQVEADSELDSGAVRIVIDTAADQNLRVAFLQDLGPAPAVVRWIVDAGAGWRARSWRASGRLSAPKLGEDGKTTFELGTLTALLDRRINRTWSHEDQKRRFPDDDGMEYMAGLASNLYRDDWPPIRR